MSRPPATIDKPATRLVRFLTDEREASKLSQAQIANILGIGQPDVSKIERLERRIDALECVLWLDATSKAQGVDPAVAWNDLYVWLTAS